MPWLYFPNLLLSENENTQGFPGSTADLSKGEAFSPAPHSRLQVLQDTRFLNLSGYRGQTAAFKFTKSQSLISYLSVSLKLHSSYSAAGAEAIKGDLMGNNKETNTTFFPSSLSK